MFTQTFSWKVLGSALLSVALISGCSATQETTASAQTQALIAQGPTQDAPELPGTAIPVCAELAHKGLAASSYPIDNGFAIELGAYDDDIRTNLQQMVSERVDARQAIEEAFADVKATKHDDGHGIYVRFEHEDAEVLDQLKDVLQQGIDSRPAASRRVTLRRGDQRVEMQLPSGGPLITSKTDSAAKDTVSKWTDRAPTVFTYEENEHGATLRVQSHDQDRLDELRKDIVGAIFSCEAR